MKATRLDTKEGVSEVKDFIQARTVEDAAHKVNECTVTHPRPAKVQARMRVTSSDAGVDFLLIRCNYSVLTVSRLDSVQGNADRAEQAVALEKRIIEMVEEYGGTNVEDIGKTDARRMPQDLKVCGYDPVMAYVLPDDEDGL